MMIAGTVAKGRLKRNKMIDDHFSHVHATFWLGIKHCYNRRRNLVPDESGPRFA